MTFSKSKSGSAMNDSYSLLSANQTASPALKNSFSKPISKKSTSKTTRNNFNTYVYLPV